MEKSTGDQNYGKHLFWVKSIEKIDCGWKVCKNSNLGQAYEKTPFLVKRLKTIDSRSKLCYTKSIVGYVDYGTSRLLAKIMEKIHTWWKWWKNFILSQNFGKQ